MLILLSVKHFIEKQSVIILEEIKKNAMKDVECSRIPTEIKGDMSYCFLKANQYEI